MDSTKENFNPNPRDGANPLSVLFFTYTFGMFKKGLQNAIDVNDLHNPLRSDRSQLLGDRLERKWIKHYEKTRSKNKHPSLLKVLTMTFWPEYLWLGVILFIMDVLLRLSQPIMLGHLLDHFQANSTTTKQEALWYAGAIVVLNALSALLINQYYMGAFHYGMKVRAACCALIYRKALRLSKTALGDTASGKIVNLLSNDVSRFDMVSILIHHMWVAPTATLCVAYFLYVEADYAGIIGTIPFFVVVPLQAYTGKLSAIYRKQTALKTDERVRLMDEIVAGIQVIKMYAWEKPFTKLIKLSRKAELKVIMKSSYVRGLYMTFNLFTTRLALFCTLLTMALTDQEITAAKVFVLVSYFNILAQTISAMFVRGISEIAEMLVAIKRLQGFMMNEEYISVDSLQNNNDGKVSKYTKGKYIVSLEDLSAKWSPASSETALNRINLNVEKEKLIGIIGPVGSGKSALLQTILGELNVVEGSIKIEGTLSYASQEPWVFGASVRQNIIFGGEFDKKRYDEVIQACALEKDFEQFPDGDHTIVSDRGASLSGGQKARISLARAIYRDADIYLLDDPLSAVDIHIAKHLFDVCINGYLKHKTRILVTHQVHLLKNADHILILNNGSVENEGNYEELSSSDNLYAKLLANEQENEGEKLKQIEHKLPRRMSIRSNKSSVLSSISELSIPDSILAENRDELDEIEEQENQKTSKGVHEESSKGQVQGSIFFKYMLYGSNCCFVFTVFVLFTLSQLAASAVDYFVSFWVNIEEFRNITQPTSNLTDEVSVTDFKRSIVLVDWSTETCLYVYGGLIISLWCFALSRSVLFYKLAMFSSQKLHDTMFYNVITATMRFFDTNPSGRILNRFAKDIGAIDELLPKAILDAGQMILTMAGSLVLVAIVNPYFLVIVAIISVFFILIRHIFLKTSTCVKRFEGMMKSPVFTHLNATIQGLTTIRAYRAQAVLRNEFDKHQDSHTGVWFMFISASVAFGFYTDVLCFIVVGSITLSFLTFGEYFGLSGSEVGLAITQATALTGMIQWGMRQSAEIVNQLMSVERVLEYEMLPKETNPPKPTVPPNDWPNKGEIAFGDMGLKYDELGTLVLKNLNLTIQPREKVGIVGRTGAGKSSLISALFRLAPVEGNIVIDSIDTKELNLDKLRTKISIIPQDPVLFSGTLRYNLDPFDEYSDEVLYRALNEVELKDPTNTINRLESRVMDRGSNYSVGQRQLICLARAIVRNNKILMLDEATANVDPQTDALIQKTIRRKFADCTVLTVAHRLNTIMDSDKVLVMESGTMVEFDRPYNLLQNADSTFAKMVAGTGPSMAEQLKRIARESLQKQQSVPEEFSSS